jgi:hypothetical protein
MKSIRDYINLVTDTDLLAEKVTLPADPSQPVQTQTVNGVTSNAPANSVQTGSGGVLKSGSGAAVTSGTPAPDPNAAAAAKAKLTPSQLKWLGGADATDPAIMARMPKPLPGEQAGQAAQPAADPNAPLTTPPGAEPDAAPEAAATGLAEPTDADVAAATPPGPAGAPGAQDDVTGVDAAVAAQAASGQAAQPAQAANRDAMPFGQAFADAKAKGEKEFTWKGKKYAVKMAPAGGQAAQPAKVPVNTAPKPGQFATNAGGAAFGNPNIAKQAQKSGATQINAKESAYTEDQTLASIIHLAGLK